MTIKQTGHVYNMWEYKGWGRAINWLKFEDRTIYGHYSLAGLLQMGANKKPTRLQVGDELRCKMQSGSIARFLISEVKYECDPEDMFFGKVEDLGYVEESS